MKRRQRRNPGAMVTIGWAAGSAAVAATLSYLVLREYYTTKVLERCAGSLRQSNPALDPEGIRRTAKALL